MGITNYQIGVFVLAKNEEANIATSLDSLESFGWPVHILDSGSTDLTEHIVSRYSFAHFTRYHYVDHCTAYNEITSQLCVNYDYVVILDADMRLSPDLHQEIEREMKLMNGKWDVMIAPVRMCSEGTPLRHASLCPPKPFLFRSRRSYFRQKGHAECLAHDVSVKHTLGSIVHDDRKNYLCYLESQHRYSGKLVERYRKGQVSGRDHIRVRTPFLVVAIPALSYFLKLGFLDGRAGLIYALDRLIAEAIMYRQAVADSMKDN